MSEVVNTYLLTDPETLITMDRKEFYTEQVEEFNNNGKPSRAVEIVQVFIFNTRGEMLIQKRSFDKAHNAGLLDKSLGGHMKHGDDADYTTTIETIQELHAPSIVLKNDADFIRTLDTLQNFLTSTSVIKRINSDIVTLKKIIHDKDVEIGNKYNLYFGVFDGRVRPVDSEAKGFIWYTLPELDRELERSPETFTHDIHYFVKEYRKEMESFLKIITTKD